jgi:hypothetical protein
MTMKRNELRTALTLIALAFGAATLPSHATNSGSGSGSASGSASSAAAGSDASSGTSAAAAGGTNSAGPSTATAGRDKESTAGTNAPAATGTNRAGVNSPPVVAASPAAPMNAADQQLADSVKAALAADARLKDANLNAYASNGDITISGTVKDQAQGDRAMQVAQGVSGVKKVTPSIMITAR